MNWLVATVIALKLGAPVVLKSPQESTRWFRAFPIVDEYQSDSVIRYREQEIVEARGKKTLDVTQLVNSAGTHLIRANQTHWKIVLREDETYAGYLSELFGVPFVEYPKRTRWGHPADLRTGADCIALVIYGKRRSGCHVPYVGPAALFRYADKVTEVRDGDILHFGFQTAVLAKDKEKLGVVDDNDEVIHTYHGVAERRRFGELPYRKSRFDILRWKPCESDLLVGSP